MAYGYLLDTNIISYMLDGKDSFLVEKISGINETDLFVSSITCYEIQFGLTRHLMKSPSSKRLLTIQSRWNQWAKGLNVVPFDEKAAAVAAQFNASLSLKGRVMQQPDMFIASQAIANKLILISHDHRAFEGLNDEGLFWEDWSQT